MSNRRVILELGRARHDPTDSRCLVCLSDIEVER